MPPRGFPIFLQDWFIWSLFIQNLLTGPLPNFRNLFLEEQISELSPPKSKLWTLKMGLSNFWSFQEKTQNYNWYEKEKPKKKLQLNSQNKKRPKKFTIKWPISQPVAFIEAKKENPNSSLIFQITIFSKTKNKKFFPIYCVAVNFVTF